MKTKAKNKKLQDNENGEKKKNKKKKKKKKKKEKLEHCWTQHIGKKRKKEQTFLVKQTVTSLHRLKKRRKENRTFLNCDCNIVLTCCKVKLFEFEFKGDIRNFFSCSYCEIWRKPLIEDFILGLLIFVIILILKFFFRIWGFRGIGNILGGFLFWGIGGWRENKTDIHPIGADCCRVDGKGSNSIEEFASPWSCKGLWRLLIFF